MTKVRVADYIAARCVQAGASDVFLITGGGAMHLNDAFGRNKSLKVTCFHHEQAAAIAAEAYYRYSQRLPVLNVTTGPGGINALNGVYGAYVDSMAMLVVSGQVKRETYIGSYDLPLRQLGDQEVDIISVARHLLKYGTVLHNASDVRRVMDKAIFLATTGRPGPVWVDVPVDIQSTLIDVDALLPWDEQLRGLLDDPDVTPNTRAEIESRLNADECSLRASAAAIAERLLAAKRPVLFLGNGVRLAGVAQQVRDLAERLHIPVVTGWNAHDLLPNEHRCYAGRPGTVGDRAGNFAVQNADVVVVLGCRLNIRQISYNWKSFASRAWKAMVDIDPVELRKPTLSADLPVCADLGEFLPMLQDELANVEKQRAHLQYLAWCRERVQRYPVVLPEYRANPRVLNPYVFVEELFNLLPSDAAAVAGNGSACVIGFQAARLRPDQRFFTNSGDASMGYDLPAAIGVALARRGKPVYCLAGDGSLMMNLQELQTLVGYGLPVKVIVLNNQGYLSIKQTQHAYFSDNVFGTGPDDGVTMPDFVRLAHGFGLPAVKVQTLDELRSKQVQDLLAFSGPALIDVHVDPQQTFAPKLASRKLEDGTMVSPALEDMAPFLSREELAANTLQP
jgi:acetolactate synthase-1/2/3 large subunit